MTTRHGRLVALFVLATLVLAGCAAGTNVASAGAPPDAGFWLGLWHGVIVPVTFVISLFTDDVSIYEVRNNGNWYDFGFVLGLTVSFGGGAGGSSAGRRRGTRAATRKRT